MECCGILEFSFSSVLFPVLQLTVGKFGSEACVKKFDFLHFLSKKDPSPQAKILRLKETKIVFSSCAQLGFQVR